MALNGCPLVEPGMIWIRGRNAAGQRLTEIKRGGFPAAFGAGQSFRHVTGFGDYFGERSFERWCVDDMRILNLQLAAFPTRLGGVSRPYPFLAIRPPEFPMEVIAPKPVPVALAVIAPRPFAVALASSHPAETPEPRLIIP